MSMNCLKYRVLPTILFITVCMSNCSLYIPFHLFMYVCMSVYACFNTSTCSQTLAKPSQELLEPATYSKMYLTLSYTFNDFG